MNTLVQIKLLHTAVWSFFAGCIVATPIVGGRGHYAWAAVLIGLVLVEYGGLKGCGIVPLWPNFQTHRRRFGSLTTCRSAANGGTGRFYPVKLDAG